MAKGNNGNLLQHTLEAEIACCLYSIESRGLHVVLTHGWRRLKHLMHVAQDHRRSSFERWLTIASGTGGLDGMPAVAKAYRTCGASPSHYPNSIEVIASLVPSISGVITEIDGEKYEQLAARWKGTGVTVLNQSWRCQNAVIADPPQDLRNPWIISLDPMIFSDGETADDDMLRPGDLDLLAQKWHHFVSTGRPGAIAAFCYSMQPHQAAAFREAMMRLAFRNRRSSRPPPGVGTDMLQRFARPPTTWSPG